MAVPVTAKFGKMRLLLGVFPDVTAPLQATTNSNPTRCTVLVGDITKFKNGKTVVIAGVTGTGMTVANGTWTITNVNNPANTFTLVGCNTAGAATPAAVVGNATTKNEAGVVTYATPCGLTSKNATISKNLAEVSIPDCTDEDAPIWLGRDVQSLSCTISGDGVAAAESVPAWDVAALSTDSVPMKVELEFGVGNKVITGRFHVDSEAFAADAGGRVTLAINAQSDGACTAVWTATP
jgi:hypothetical protein